VSKDEIKDGKRVGMRKPLPTPTEQRTRFKALANQLKKGKRLTRDQIEYLASRFERIGDGESADAVFHLKRSAGKKVEDEQHRRTMSLVFLQIAHLMDPPPLGNGFSLMNALEAVVPLARGLFGVENSEKYSVEYLYKLWYDPSYAHMRTTLRTPFDRDSPFSFIPAIGKPETPRFQVIPPLHGGAYAASTPFAWEQKWKLQGSRALGASLGSATSFSQFCRLAPQRYGVK